MKVELTLNGTPAVLNVRTDEMLHDALRAAGLRSVRETCGIGVCGTCTVLLDGEPVSGCLLLAVEADGSEVVTVEGLASDDPVPQAFARAHAFQCGYCTPGMVLAAKRLLKDPGSPSEEEIRLALAGNLCRCGCYLKIAEAIRLAAAAGAR